MIPQPHTTKEHIARGKPILRGWFHAVAAVMAIIITLLFFWSSRNDAPRLFSLVIFGASMIEMYTISAIYHIMTWKPAQRRVLRTFDHANIFVLIAGTYTPICFNILSGWIRGALLVTIWALALLGISFAFLSLARNVPRWLNVCLYIVMGWVAVLAFPAFLSVLPWQAVGVLILGGVLYTIGGVIYALRRPDPWPSIFGYHEIFHLFVIAGSAAFTACIWVWVLPFTRL